MKKILIAFEPFCSAASMAILTLGVIVLGIEGSERLPQMLERALSHLFPIAL